MSDFQQKDMTGAIFRNDKRNGNERAPNATGTAMIDGVIYRISAWTKEGKNGRFQSLAFSRREGDAPTKHDDHAAPTPRGAFYGDDTEPF